MRVYYTLKLNTNKTLNSDVSLNYKPLLNAVV